MQGQKLDRQTFRSLTRNREMESPELRIAIMFLGVSTKVPFTRLRVFNGTGGKWSHYSVKIDVFCAPQPQISSWHIRLRPKHVGRLPSRSIAITKGQHCGLHRSTGAHESKNNKRVRGGTSHCSAILLVKGAHCAECMCSASGNGAPHTVCHIHPPRTRAYTAYNSEKTKTPTAGVIRSGLSSLTTAKSTSSGSACTTPILCACSRAYSTKLVVNPLSSGYLPSRRASTNSGSPWKFRCTKLHAYECQEGVPAQEE